MGKSDDNAVKIMNIHKSKGLEFPLCYFTGMHNLFTIKELSNKLIVTNKYGMILPYLNDDALETTVIKDLYANEFLREEISEKIRLLYVALTRCREKMIIVTSLDMEHDGYNNLVPNSIRMRYRSFLDILNSVNYFKNFVTVKKANYTDLYEEVSFKELDIIGNSNIIPKQNISLDIKILDNKRFSKNNIDIFDSDIIKKMEFGTKLHESLEYADFYDKNNEYVSKLLKHVPDNYINVYKEYEFIDKDEDTNYHGVIDLILEYDDEMYIIDYKLKSISDSDYLKQLEGYKHYLEKITDKKINTYLYSIIDDVFVNV